MNPGHSSPIGALLKNFILCDRINISARFLLKTFRSMEKSCISLVLCCSIFGIFSSSQAQDEFTLFNKN